MVKELILLTDVEGLGREADIVKVPDGYARNFLIPKKIAAPVSKTALRKIEKNKTEREEKRRIEVDAAKAIEEKLAALSCTINAKVGDNDKLFGSITSADIADVLKTHGIDVDKKKINLPEPIRELGVFEVKIKLHHDVIATVKIWIVEE